eukprot:m.259124 g.259124  ORF g.259124 m.259124 type:complete len:189 (+) comp19659_c0_seq3:268-834(+)
MTLMTTSGTDIPCNQLNHSRFRISSLGAFCHQKVLHLQSTINVRPVHKTENVSGMNNKKSNRELELRDIKCSTGLVTRMLDRQHAMHPVHQQHAQDQQPTELSVLVRHDAFARLRFQNVEAERVEQQQALNDDLRAQENTVSRLRENFAAMEFIEKKLLHLRRVRDPTYDSPWLFGLLERESDSNDFR